MYKNNTPFSNFRLENYSIISYDIWKICFTYHQRWNRLFLWNCVRPCLKSAINSSKQPNHNCSHVYKCKERLVKLVISCCTPTKPFNFLKEALNEMPFFAAPIIYPPRFLRITFGRNHNGCTMFSDIRKNFLCHAPYRQASYCLQYLS